MDKMNLMQRFNFSLNRKLFLPNNSLMLLGEFRGGHYRQKKNGNFKLIEKLYFKNGVKNAAKDSLLNTMFNGASQVTSTNWCLSLIDNSGSPIENSNDTLSSKSWTEFNGYSQTNRVTWGQGTSTAQLLTNASLCVFDISVTGVIYGGLVASDNTKGGNGGLLWSTGAFPSPVNVTGGTDQIRLSYNLAL